MRKKIKVFGLLLLMTFLPFYSLSAKAVEINKEINDCRKLWTVKFNTDIEYTKDIEKDITITDENGNNAAITLRPADSKTIRIDPPQEGYAPEKIYTIHISKNVHSIGQKYLTKEVNYTFKVKKEESVYPYKQQIETEINKAVEKILKDGVQDDWQALAVSKQGSTVPASYLNAIQNKIKESKGNLAQPTDYERTVLALLSIGQDPSNFQGYNLVEKIYTHPEMESQGVNAFIFALISLDAGKYEIPNSATWTREKLIETILENRTSDYGWDYAGIKADPDLTGMALTALSNYKEQPETKLAIEQAVEKLASMQKPNGGFASWGAENSESVSQVIIALCSNGIDPTTDSRFCKNGKNVIDALLEYKVESGGFCHVKGTGYNIMATEQAVQALEAYRNFKEGTSKLYDFKK